MAQRFHVVTQVVLTPVILTILAVGFGFFLSWWFLVAIPFIWLGAFCSAPNMNLADGCLAQIAIVGGFVLWLFFKPLGLAIFAGAASSYYISSFEKLFRVRPANEDTEQ